MDYMCILSGKLDQILLATKLLRDIRSVATSCSSLSQDPCSPAVGAQPGEQGPGSLPRLRDTAVAFLSAGLTSSKAEHTSQRHPGERQDTATDCHTSCHRHSIVVNSTRL